MSERDSTSDSQPPQDSECGHVVCCDGCLKPRFNNPLKGYCLIFTKKNTLHIVSVPEQRQTCLIKRVIKGHDALAPATRM